MSKIAIISRPDQGVLIDVSGCATLEEVIEQLNSTLQLSSHFWKGTPVDLNLGSLTLAEQQVAQLLALTKGLGVTPRQVFSLDLSTRSALDARGVTIGLGKPMSLPTVAPVEAEGALPVEVPQVTAEEPNITSITIDTTEDRIVMVETDETPDPEDAPKLVNFVDPNLKKEEEPTLFLKQGLRSGQAVSHSGNLVIIGDVNPGAEVVAAGDITVWGALRGIAHAGIGGNDNAEIRALKLEPIQIRISNAIARSPDRTGIKVGGPAAPESARLIEGKIRITRSYFE
jgi:septum site-determining protein MinC